MIFFPTKVFIVYGFIKKKYFDIKNIEEIFCTSSGSIAGLLLCIDIDFDTMKIKSGKKVVCGDKVYESLYDMNGRKNLDEFFIDLGFYRVYSE